MLLYSEKKNFNEIFSLSKEYFYFLNSKNKIMYFAKEKGVSIESIIDSMFLPTEKGLFIYENINNDEIAIVYINNTTDSIVFNIKHEGEFSTRKIENFIKVICLKDSIYEIYFFENSKIEKNVNLPDFITKNFVEKSLFKKHIKKVKPLKSSQNKIISALLFCIAIVLFEMGMGKGVEYLSHKSDLNFNKNHASLEQKKSFIKEELLKYEGLSQNLRDIQVVNSKEEYLNRNLPRQDEQNLNNKDIF